jgi:hypothetical protein
MSAATVTLTAERLGELLIREAARFVGLREVKPNADWDNPKTPGPDADLARELRELMRPTPWAPGWAYCIAFIEAIVRKTLARAALTPAEAAKVLDVLGPHVLTTFRKFKALGLITPTPVPGAIWLAQHGASENGHAGLVTSIARLSPTVSTIEANTALDSRDPAKDREGDWITTRAFLAGGRGTLRTLGFVSPAALLKLLSS